MRKKIFFVAVTLGLLCGISLTAKPKSVYNKYGMKLVNDGGTLSVSQSDEYIKTYGVDPATLEDVLEPYKPKKYEGLDTVGVKTEDFVYKTTKDGRELHIAVDFAMDQSVKAPVLFQIHGGAWMYGDLKSYHIVTRSAAKLHNVTCVRIQYSLVAKGNGVTFKDMIEDVCDAVKYVCENAEKFNVDVERIGFMGQSAGAHLAACGAAMFPQTKLLIGYYGPYDLKLLFAGASKKFIRKLPLKGATNRYDPEYIASVSPVNMLKTPVNFVAVLYQGTLDITVPKASVDVFSEKLKECGCPKQEVIICPNATHSLGRSMYSADNQKSTLEAIGKYL